MIPIRAFWCVGIIAVAVGLSTGCGSTARGPYSPNATAEQRNIPEGERLFQKAMTIIEKDGVETEKLLNEALTADLYHGPAHNNLGVLLLKKGKLYEAANEFTWAGKLLSGHPDPRVNLAMALEQGGKSQDAIASCKTALEIQPGYLPAIQTAALIQAHNGIASDDQVANLSTIIERSSDPIWRDWAMKQRLAINMRETDHGSFHP
ncbi:MAG: hypothetical protein H0W83_04670 [Planctomycetes bacterium]|nr:hypothetical protein [Planctomycetota bacterium]